MNNLLKRFFVMIGFVLVGCGQVEGERPLALPTEPVEVVSTARPTPTAPTIPTTEPTAISEPLQTVEPTTLSEASSEQRQALPSAGSANADVLFVQATETSANVWTFSVTVAHPDTGWEDYADGWDVMLPDGTVLLPNANNPFTRLLTHPHETEQPFTRSQGNINIPAGITEVTVRAHDIVDGFGGQEVVVALTAVSTDQYEVIRLQQP